ncbi:MAG: glycosyltransferase family 4 protein [Candidatus Kapaibacterium sp.]
MKKVLVIAYYFPPLGLSGVQRTLKFVKYLHLFGWHPTVITVGETGYYAKDETLLKEISPRIRVIRTTSRDVNSLVKNKGIIALPKEKFRKFLSKISDFFFIPDSKIGWKRAAVRAASELLTKEKFDVIFATAPPQTALLIGIELKKRFNIPLVVDYRDLWVDYPFKTFSTIFHKKLHIHLETKVLHAANIIITASDNIRQKLLGRYQFLTSRKVMTIPQGYDPEDMEIPAAPRHDGVMRITYAGLFYENRTPEYFLQALHQFFKHRQSLRGKIEAHFLGAFREEHLAIISRLGLEDSVVVHGYLSHRDCVEFLLDSDVLWLMMQDDESTPGKIFEYIGTGKKILGCVPEGTMRDIITEASGTCCMPDNVGEIEMAIEDVFGTFLRNELTGASKDIIEKYNRKKLTGRLALVLDSLQH